MNNFILKDKLNLKSIPRPSAAEFRPKRHEPCVFLGSIENPLARTLDFDNIKQRLPNLPIRLQKSLCSGDLEIHTTLHKFIDHITSTEDLKEAMVLDRKTGDTYFENFSYKDSLYCLRLNCCHNKDLIAHVTSPGFLGDWFDLYLPKFRSSVVYGKMHTWFFIGPKGTLSELHSDHDEVHTTIQQSCGSKRFFTIKPSQQKILERILGDHALSSLRFEVSGDSIKVIDESREPLEELKKIDIYVHDLKAGETIYLPAGTGHYAESLTNSISISRDFVDDRNIDNYLCSIIFETGLANEAARFGLPEGIDYEVIT